MLDNRIEIEILERTFSLAERCEAYLASVDIVSWAEGRIGMLEAAGFDELSILDLKRQFYLLGIRRECHFAREDINEGRFYAAGGRLYLKVPLYAAIAGICIPAEVCNLRGILDILS